MTAPATSTDEAALLAAIAAEPDEDTPRLVYADWLDENGDGDRAEFIRVQCELARLCKDEFHADRLSDPLCIRQRELLALHGDRWRQCPCPECRPKPHEMPEKTGRLIGCAVCGGSGDLLVRVRIEDDQWPRLDSRPVTFHRGFPRVVARLADCGWEVTEKCERCEGSGLVRYYAGYGTEGLDHCPECHHAGTVARFRPTPWLAALVAAVPVVEVWVEDREPEERERDGAMEYGWCLGARANPDPLFMLPPPIWALLERGRPWSSHWICYPTPDLARVALARAVPAWARGEGKGG